MAHIRKRVRAAMAQALAAAGLNVKAARAWPVTPAALPAVLVYVRDEELEADSMGGATRDVLRRMRVLIEALAAATQTVDDDLDALAVTIETALAADRTLGGLTHDLRPESARLQVQAEGEKVFGVLEMEWLAVACTAMNDPEG